jgi:beta-phosphoglucomutase
MRIFNTYITDLDGTLCDTLEANVAAYHRAFEDAGLPFDEAVYRANFGHRFNEMMDAIAPHTTAKQRDAIAERKSIHYPQQTELVAINDNLVDILRYAKAGGALIGLATTAKQRNASVILEHFELTELFDATIFGEDVTHGKPHPECYQLVLQKLRAAPESSIIFEDSEIGIEAARAAGAHVIKVAL